MKRFHVPRSGEAIAWRILFQILSFLGLLAIIPLIMFLLVRNSHGWVEIPHAATPKVELPQ